MADTAFQTQYRQEFIAVFEQHKSLLSQMCTTEAVIKGNQATFLVAGSGPAGSPATAVTRGPNGLIPARADSNTQLTATLQEWHDLVRKTGFNIFASQGDQRRIMQMSTLGTINRKIDLDIIGELDNGATQHAGSTAVTGSLALVARALTILGNQQVPLDGNVYGVISPGFYAYLLQSKEFADSDYTTNTQFNGNKGAYGDTQRSFFWAGVTWTVSPLLTGTGTSSEKCYIFHKSAIGHAVNTAGMDSLVDYNGEQQYSWARASIFMGSKTLQATGIVQILHDASAYVAT